MRKLKIMYLLFSFTVGGTEKLVTDICNEMSRIGHEVYLYIVNHYYSEDMLKGLSDDVKIQLQNRIPGQESIVKTILRIECFVKEQHIEIIHCNSLDSPELLALTRLLQPKIKVVYTIHDVRQWSQLNKLRSVYRNILCQRIIAISESVKQDIIFSGARASKVSVVYNAIDLSKFRPQEGKKHHDYIRIGNVARIVPDKKGQDILIKAVAMVREKYPQICCIFAGDADKSHQKSLEELKDAAIKLGVDDCVKFIGEITDVPEFLRTLDIFVLPSRFEGFGLSLVEAMAMRIPCIASNLNGPAEIIGNEERGLLFPSGDADALAKKLVYAIEHEAEMAKIAEIATNYVTEHFDIRNMCKELVRLY